MSRPAGAPAAVTKLLGNSAPTEAEQLLLRAGLLDAPDAATAWRAWLAGRDLESAHIGERRLLPLVYRNLVRLGVDGPSLARLRGIHRHDWYRNQLLFAAGAEAIERLHAEGVPTIVLKGAALAGLHYRDAGSRPMSDVDVLVPPDDAAAAVAMLGAAGWSPHPRAPRDLFAVRHAWSFRREDEREVDVQWRVFAYSRAGEDDVWTSAVPLTLSGVTTMALCASDQLLHVLAHGLAWNPVSPVRWIPDAVAVLRAADGALDWDRFCTAAARHGVAYSATAGLQYLQATFAPAIPDSALRRLRRTPQSGGERRLHEAMVGRPHRVRRAMRIHWAAYRALRSPRVRGARRLGFAGFMLRRWEIDGARAVPAFVAGKLAERQRPQEARG